MYITLACYPDASIYPVVPPLEDYVQLGASKKSMVEDGLNELNQDNKYDSVSMRKK